MTNKISLDDNASASPEFLSLRELLRSWLEEVEHVENAPKQKMESGRRCPS